MVTRRVVLGAVAWCLVVLLGGAVVWQAIDAAGRGIFNDEAVGPNPTPSDVPTSPAPSSGPSSGPTSGSAPTHGSSPTPGSSPTSRAPTTADTGGDPPTTPEPTPAPEPQSRSWQGAEGRVVVRCDGARAGLESASPADGYRMEIDERGPDEVRVEFSREDRETRVQARCEAGIPAFEVDESGSGDSG